jgi:SAM-dependent methyltransferase
LSAPLLTSVLQGVVIASASVAFLYQFRKPSWLPGRAVAQLMNASHRTLTEWGLTHLPIGPNSAVLDVGCGGGGTIARLDGREQNLRLTGIDYSAASVAVARRTNAAAFDAGRVDIREASVSKLPFDANTFDAALAVETHYYWPDLVGGLREIHRVLRPSGRLAIMAEAYRGKRFGALDLVFMRLVRARLLSIDEHRQALLAAGFTTVEMYEERKRGWMCVVGVKS